MAKAQKEQETVITETVSDIRDLNANDCLLIRALSGTKEYQNTKSGSRYDGKEFRTFLYKGKGFTVIKDDAFCKDIDDDNLDSVSLRETEDGYEFLGHISGTRSDNVYYRQEKRKAFKLHYVQNAKPLEPEDFA